MTTYVTAPCMCCLPVVHRWLYTVSIVSLMACVMLHYVFSSPWEPHIIVAALSLWNPHTMHTVSTSTFWLPCMILHYIWIILLMVMYDAKLGLSHLLDSKLCLCHLINNVWHSTVSGSSPWWTRMRPHSVCITFLMTTFDPILCLCHLPHDHAWCHPVSTSSLWWPHTTPYLWPPPWMHIILLYDWVMVLAPWGSLHSYSESKSSLWESHMMLHTCLPLLMTICDSTSCFGKFLNSCLRNSGKNGMLFPGMTCSLVLCLYLLLVTNVLPSSYTPFVLQPAFEFCQWFILITWSLLIVSPLKIIFSCLFSYSLGLFS